MSRIVVSLGGSLIVPEKVQTGYLKRLKQFINQKTAAGFQFLFVCGGGKTAREYIDAGNRLDLSAAERDHLGIRSTLINAELVNYYLKTGANVLTKPDFDSADFTKPVLLAGGWDPGYSSDYSAVLYATFLNTKTVINLTNVDHVYSKNPKTSDNAKPLKDLSWQDYLNLVGQSWNSGDHFPFDPFASKLAQKNHINVYIVKGTLLQEFDKILHNKSFKGTLLHK